MSNKQVKNDSPPKLKSKADVNKQGYRPNRKLKPLHRFAFNTDPATLEYRRQMESLVTTTEMAKAAALISKRTDERLASTKRKRRKSGPRKSVSMFAGLKLTDIII